MSDVLTSLQLIAASGIVNPDYDAFVHRVQRFYSRTFHTPLHVVAELPIYDVFLAFFEQMYEDMSAEDLQGIIAELTETEEQKRARIAEEEKVERAGEEMADLLNQQIAAGTLKGPPIRKKIAPPTPKKPPEKEVVKPTEPEFPTINMQFGGDGNLLSEDFLNSDPLGNVRKIHG